MKFYLFILILTFNFIYFINAFKKSNLQFGSSSTNYSSDYNMLVLNNATNLNCYNDWLKLINNTFLDYIETNSNYNIDSEKAFKNEKSKIKLFFNKKVH